MSESRWQIVLIGDDPLCFLTLVAFSSASLRQQTLSSKNSKSTMLFLFYMNTFFVVLWRKSNLAEYKLLLF